MAILGCHSCKVNIQDYKDVPYQQTPCAKCRLANQSTRTFKRINLFDSDAAVDQLQDQIQEANQQQSFAIPTQVPKRLVDEIKRACQTNMMITMSNIILRLLKLAKQYPTTAKVLLAKMQHPQLSYYQIGAKLRPVCSKQNILYHLKHAVQQFPQLDSALLIDTRFSGSKGSAVHSVAQLKKNSNVVSKLKQSMYQDTQHNTAKSLEQLNDIFNMPYNEQELFVAE